MTAEEQKQVKESKLNRMNLAMMYDIDFNTVIDGTDILWNHDESIYTLNHQKTAKSI